MKKLLTPLASLLSLTLVMSSCEKDEVKAVVQPGEASALTASATSIPLSSSNASQTAINYSWAPVSFGYQAAVTYTLQFAKAGTNFATPYELNVGNATSKSLTVAEINDILVSRLRQVPNNAVQVDVRVKSSVSDKVDAVYSPVKQFSATPYLVIINYPSLYVPGNYQGWAPATAPKISAFTSTAGAYEGYVNLNDPAPQFKFTSDPDWSHTNYGDGGAGALSTNGGAGNLTVPTTGYYRLKANTTAMTWEAVKTTWTVIGSSTPNGWNSDTPLTYDATAGTWSARLTLTAGEIKFRANNDWTINFGDGSNTVAPDGLLDYGGNNIAVPTAGTYTVTLDLSRPGNYTYSVR